MYSRWGLDSGEKLVIRNQEVTLLSLGPELVPTTYLTREPFDVSLTSGSVPNLPTIVMRASCEVLLVENARLEMCVIVAGERRIGDKRKDMAVGGRQKSVHFETFEIELLDLRLSFG